MKAFLLMGLLLTSTIAVAQKDPLMEAVAKIEAKEKSKKDFDRSLASLTKSLSSPTLNDSVKNGILSVIKDSDPELHQAYLKQEAKQFKKEKAASVDMLSNTAAALSGCEMSYDQTHIYCPQGDYKRISATIETATRGNSKSDLPTKPKKSGVDVLKGASHQ